MTRAVYSALFALAMTCPAFAQKPIAPPPAIPIPEQTSRLKSSEYKLAIKGCIRNKRLTLSAIDSADIESSILRASEFILSGPKELMRQIQEQHNGHDDEIEGVVTVPPPVSGGTTTVQTKKVGPVTVGAGSHEESGPVVVDTPRPLSMKVTSLTHITEGCVERR